MELRAFVQRVRGAEVPVVTGVEGLAALRVAFRILDEIGPPGQGSG